MGLLSSRAVAAAAVFATGCYEPELRDCTLMCNAAAECASGQVCGADHFCAAPEVAGTCATLPGNAGSGDRDAGVADARMPQDAAPDARPDSLTHVQLAITIDAKGRVAVQGIGTCDAAPPQNGSCMFMVPVNMPLTATATASVDWRFERWTTAACAAVPINTCTFIPTTATPLGVKFKKQ